MTVIIVMNAGLHRQPAQDDLLKKMRSLKNDFDQNADVGMQRMYPEGYVFMNSLYALAWSSVPGDEAAVEIERSFTKINSTRGRSSFNKNLSLPYGAFYNGWSTYVLGSRLRRNSNSNDIELFKQQCDGINTAIQQKTFPESYFGAAWPADVVVCVASLALHDKLFEPKYQTAINRWLTEVKGKLDDRGMIPHSMHESARGSSMALMLIFLKTIDEEFANDQFKLFKKYFVDDKFGLTGIREYPQGEEGHHDIDSGPVIMGVGGAATIVGMRTLWMYDEYELSMKIRNAVDPFFGFLPIADAFIAWSNSGITTSNVSPSFLEFHFYSFVLFVLLAIVFWIVIPKRQASSK